MSFVDIVVGLGLAGLVWCAWVRARRLLHLFQLDSYSPTRLLKLLMGRPRLAAPPELLTVIVLAVVLLGFGLVLASLEGYQPAFALAWLAGVAVSVFLSRPPQEKKPLVMTGRAKRLVVLTILICFDAAVLAAANVGTTPSSVSGALLALALWLPFSILLIPFWLLLANLVLMPVQAVLNRMFLSRARRKIRELDPLVVGITGSYGKTSTKNFCEGILQRRFNVLATPKSFNTLLGVSRTINEELRHRVEVFLVEMGAYTVGDIRSTAALVRPRVALITTIGLQHLERFGSKEAIERAKGELLDELAPDGVAILNRSEEASERLAKRVASGKVLWFAVSDVDDPEVLLRGERVEQTREGLRFAIVDRDGNRETVKSRLLGRYNVANMVAAGAIARHLGMSLAEIARALESLEAPPHRLELRRGIGGSAVIDNAYSSNPVGAHGSLEVLADLPARWRILVTPGLVELGAARATENERFGAAASKVCDHIILVGREVAAEVERGVVAAGFDSERLHRVDEVSQVGDLLVTLGVDARDLILFENDLPDLYR